MGILMKLILIAAVLVISVSARGAVGSNDVVSMAATGSLTNVASQSATPSFKLNSTSAGVNSKIWKWDSGASGTMRMVLESDDTLTDVFGMTATRAGTAPSILNWFFPTVNFSGTVDASDLTIGGLGVTTTNDVVGIVNSQSTNSVIFTNIVSYVPIDSFTSQNIDRTGVANLSQILLTAAASGKAVYFSPGTYYTSSGLLLSSGTMFIGSGTNTIIKSGETNSYAFLMADGSQLRNFVITSSYTGTLDNYTSNHWSSGLSRAIRMTNNCVVQDIRHFYAAGGITIPPGGKNCVIKNYTFQNIRGWDGLAHGIQMEGATSVSCSEIFGSDSDNFYRVFNGGTNNTVTVADIRRIYPNGFSGQPAAYDSTSANGILYSTTTGKGRIENCSADKIYFSDCSGNMLKSSDNNPNAYGADIVNNSSFTRIDIVNPRSSGFNRPIELDGKNERVETVTISGTASSCSILTYITSYSRNLVFDGVKFENYTNQCIYVQQNNTNTTIRNCFFRETTATTNLISAIIDAEGDGTRLIGNTFERTTNVAANILMTQYANNGWIIGNEMRYATNGPATASGINLNSTNTMISQNRFLGGLGQRSINITGTATRNTIAYNFFEDLSGANVNCVDADVNSTLNIIRDNWTSAGTVKFSNSSAASKKNQFFNNYEGGASATFPAVFVSTGGPNGSYTGPIGAIYLQTDAAPGMALWIKSVGTGSTSWTNVIGNGSASMNVYTNIAPLTETVGDFELNTVYTNFNQRAAVGGSFTVNAAVTGGAQVALYIRPSGGGAWAETNNIQGPLAGVSFSSNVRFYEELNPNAEFMFTNILGSGATAAKVAKSSRWVQK